MELRGPLEMILFENIAYLVSDEKKERAFLKFREEIGTNPTDILSASTERLMNIVQPAAMANKLVAQIREIALIVLQEFGGNLDEVLTRSPKQAKQALMKFPAIGEPGAEKILLFCNAYPLLALESNGLRVLVRLGYGVELKNYSATYKAAQRSAKLELEDDFVLIQRAHLLLRQHGKTTCRRTSPLCERCQISNSCEYFANRL